MMTSFTPASSFIGGIIIGIAAFMLLLFNGKIAGVSGVLKRLFPVKEGDFGWRIFFIIGMLIGGAVWLNVFPQNSIIGFKTSWVHMIVAGLLVGVGTSIGNGCTSGHGICGIGRLSKRSIIATITFMLTAVITVYIARHILGVL